MAAKVRVFTIAAAELELRGGEAPQLTVIAHGYVTSAGWTDPELVLKEAKLPADGLLDLDFVATPPDEFGLPELTPVTAVLEWKSDDVGRAIGVWLFARTNNMIRLVVREPAQSTSHPAAIADTC
jgi:hypothetical protein